MKESGHSSDGGDKPIIITMEELHSHGGTPPGWRFSIPEGDVAGGREAFVKMECFACHNIDGEKFPKKEKDPAKVGPDLSGMGLTCTGIGHISSSPLSTQTGLS